MSKNEAEEIVAELNARHKDVLDPIIRRINECYLAHDGDGVFFLFQALVTLVDTVDKMIKSGLVIPSGSGPNRPGMNA